jgi:hypothetical protein
MEKKLNLSEYGRKLYQYKNLPNKLDEINLELAGWYSFYSEKMIALELAEASFWEKHKDFGAEKPKSDPLVRALWKITEEGKQKTEYERTLSTIHILLSSIKASLNRHNTEARNLK